MNNPKDSVSAATPHPFAEIDVRKLSGSTESYNI
jgi:hypothetical protein